MVGSDLTDHMLIQESKQASKQFDVDGSAFLNDDFLTGQIHSFQGPYENIPLRYMPSMIFSSLNKTMLSICFSLHRTLKNTLRERDIVVAKHEARGKAKIWLPVTIGQWRIDIVCQENGDI